MTTKTRTILLGLIVLASALLFTPAGSSFAENEDGLEDAIQDALQIHVSPVLKQQEFIDRINNINEAIERSTSESERTKLILEKEALRPELIKNGMMFAKDFHANTEYWTGILRESGPLIPLNADQTLPATTMEGATVGSIYLTSYYTPTITPASHSEGDWYLVHRLYYSCGILVCNQGLWEYADDDDWSSVTMTISLSSGSYVRLEHEASNLRHHSVTRDFDSHWTHARGVDILDNDTKLTTQYWNAGEREVQSGLLETWNAQTGDDVYSTMRIT